ncbi:hypothetical protein GE061_009651 [Apolygus lucorum]|uniref:Uncharacterized protein n=1 Tax=Apolygus lucorum TaxID=248454 RepID=A0A8S9Y3I7_APOLU|nr:hypothetical protein GE061_009651 [Apolygus lucorum]
MSKARSEDSIGDLLDSIYSMSLGDVELNDIKDNLILAANTLRLDIADLNVSLFIRHLRTLFCVTQDRLDELDGHRQEISTLNGAYISSRELLNSSVNDHLRYEAAWSDEKEALETSVVQLKKKIRVLESKLITSFDAVDSPRLAVIPEIRDPVTFIDTQTQTDCGNMEQSPHLPEQDLKTEELTGKLDKIESLYGSVCASLVHQSEVFLRNEQSLLTRLNEANDHRCDLLKRTDKLQAELKVMRMEIDDLEREKSYLNSTINELKNQLEADNLVSPGSGSAGTSSSPSRSHFRSTSQKVPNVLLVGDSYLYGLGNEVQTLLPRKFSVNSLIMADAPLSVLMGSLPQVPSQPEYIVLSAGSPPPNPTLHLHSPPSLSSSTLHLHSPPPLSTSTLLLHSSPPLSSSTSHLQTPLSTSTLLLHSPPPLSSSTLHHHSPPPLSSSTSHLHSPPPLPSSTSHLQIPLSTSTLHHHSPPQLATSILHSPPPPSASTLHNHSLPPMYSFTRHLHSPSPLSSSTHHLHSAPPLSSSTHHLHSSPPLSSSTSTFHSPPPLCSSTHHLRSPPPLSSSTLCLHSPPPLTISTLLLHSPPPLTVSTHHLHSAPPLSSSTHCLHSPPPLTISTLLLHSPPPLTVSTHQLHSQSRLCSSTHHLHSSPPFSTSTLLLHLH